MFEGTFADFFFFFFGLVSGPTDISKKSILAVVRRKVLTEGGYGIEGSKSA
jgi:hypothetical protein